MQCGRERIWFKHVSSSSAPELAHVGPGLGWLFRVPRLIFAEHPHPILWTRSVIHVSRVSHHCHVSSGNLAVFVVVREGLAEICYPACTDVTAYMAAQKERAILRSNEGTT